MKTNEKRKLAWLVALLALVVCAGVLVTLIKVADSKKTDASEPFVCELENVSLVKQDKSSSWYDSVAFTISIVNQTDKNFHNVWYEFSLNEEVKPFIGSGILGYKSEPMDVTSRDKAVRSEDAKTVSGFESSYQMGLTPQDTLEEYYQLEQSEVVSALKEIEIKVFWDGGSQVAVCPVRIQTESSS